MANCIYWSISQQPKFYLLYSPTSIKIAIKNLQWHHANAPDNKKYFSASEHFTNGVYVQTGSGIT